MSKIVIFLVILGLINYVKADPIPNGFGSVFDMFPNMQNKGVLPIEFPNIPMPPMLTADEIKYMKPSDGSDVHGTSVSSSSVIKMVDGKPVRETTGTFVNNDNGEVVEKKFKV